MTTATQAISYVQSWAGYRDNGGAKVWASYAPSNYAPASYCGAGQGMLAKHFGLSLAPTTHERIIYVPYVVADARAAGKWKLSKDGKPGDWVIFSWGNGYHDIAASNADHIEILLVNNPALSYVTTFGFNTSDNNGNMPRGAFVRTRARSDIMGVVDRSAAYSKAAPPKSPTTPAASEAWVAGGKVVTAMQKHWKTIADGTISGQDAGRKGNFPGANWVTIQWLPAGNASGSKLVVAMQKSFGLKADGLFGPATAKALQKWAGATQDGICGTKTVAAICKKLGVK